MRNPTADEFKTLAKKGWPVWAIIRRSEGRISKKKGVIKKLPDLRDHVDFFSDGETWEVDPKDIFINENDYIYKFR